MIIKPLHKNFKMPERSTELAGGYDIYMPEYGAVGKNTERPEMVGLGFAAQVPPGHVALLLPRSGVGSKGVYLNNTVGVIDADYHGEWKAAIMKRGGVKTWNEGDRLFQFIIVPVGTPELVLGDFDQITEREGGFGSTGE